MSILRFWDLHLLALIFEHQNVPTTSCTRLRTSTRVIFHVQAGLATVNQSHSPWKLPLHVFPRWTLLTRQPDGRWPMGEQQHHNLSLTRIITRLSCLVLLLLLA
jgi:hypothetical protein